MTPLAVLAQPPRPPATSLPAWTHHKLRTGTHGKHTRTYINTALSHDSRDTARSTAKIGAGGESTRSGRGPDGSARGLHLLRRRLKPLRRRHALLRLPADENTHGTGSKQRCEQSAGTKEHVRRRSVRGQRAAAHRVTGPRYLPRTLAHQASALRGLGNAKIGRTGQLAARAGQRGPTDHSTVIYMTRSHQDDARHGGQASRARGWGGR